MNCISRAPTLSAWYQRKPSGGEATVGTHGTYHRAQIGRQGHLLPPSTQLLQFEPSLHSSLQKAKDLLGHQRDRTDAGRMSLREVNHGRGESVSLSL